MESSCYLTKIRSLFSTNGPMKPVTVAQNCWQTAKNLFLDYSEHSTVHGINYIAERNRPWCERIWWIVAFCASVLGCVQLIIDAWHINPIIISFTGKPTPIWQIPFPAVTICPGIPTNSVNLRTILREFGYGYLYLDELTEEEQQQVLALSSICVGSIRFADYDNQTNCNVCLNTLRTIRVPPEEMFYECNFRDKVIDCESSLKELWLKSGLCYTFNGAEVYRKSNVTQETEEWTIDEGYAPTASLDVYPFRATGVGVKSGLTFLLRYRRSALEYLCDKRPGFWVEYRMQHEVPRFTTGYFIVAMESSVTFIVDPKLMTTSKALRDYSVTERKCYFSDERRLKYFEYYTQPNCETECETDYVLEKCGCYPIFIERRQNLDTCGPHQQDCIYINIDKVKFSNILRCNCLPACSSINFESEVLVNELNMSDLRRTHPVNQNDYIYTELSIYFKQSQYMTSERTELYGRTEFLANCGGLLGLFVGVSFISLMEIVYFCCIRVLFSREPKDTAVALDENLPKTGGMLHVLRDLVAEYSTKTTIQGINYVANAELSRTERLWWTIVLMISIFCCGSVIHDTAKHYEQSPVIVTLATDETPISEIPFPAITVCPQVTAFEVEEVYHYLITENHSLFDLNQEFTDSVTALAQVCDPEVFGDLDPKNLTNCEKCSDILFELLGSLSHVMSNCRDLNSLETCEDLFKAVMTENGVCFTFNGLDVYRQDNGTDGGTIEQWTLENGYENVNGQFDEYPRVGSKIDLTVVLKIYKIMNDRVCKGPIQGFKLFLHLPNEVPQISKHYYMLPYDYITQISINPKMIITAPELRDFPVEKRQCYFNEERHLRFFRYYTQSNCESDCLANMTIEKCGCLRFHMPKIPGIKYCGISDIKCYQSVIQLSIEQNIDRSQFSDCNCLPACTSISYDTEINQIFSSNFYVEDDFDDWELFDFAAFSVVFKENQFIALQRSQLYGMTEFVANCGGLLGLFLGFSFMSILELVYFCTIRFVCNFKSRVSKNNRT